MSEQIKDGGPAFPCEQHEANDNNWNQTFDPGMSLRHYFAAKALQGLMANPGGPIQQNGMDGWGFVNCTPDGVAGLCIDMADAQLAAFEAKP